MSSVSAPASQPLRPGFVHSASTPATTKVLEDLLHKDYTLHHCFFNEKGFHNHLGHHLVAAYDLGAPAALLQMIYDNEHPMLLPVDRQGEDITEANWTKRLGEHRAYGSYLAFFTEQITTNGVAEVVKKFVVAPEANGNGALMLARLVGGALHPLLEIGFGIEFEQDYMVAQGLAMGAVTEPDFLNFVTDESSGIPAVAATSKGVTLLSLLRELYDSEILKPLPYVPDVMDNDMGRFQKLTENPERGAEIKRIYAKWSIDTTLTGAAPEQEFANKAEECFFQATLLLAATGRPGRAPRADFFLMHILTSALCIPSLLSILSDPMHKAQLLQAYARASAMYILLRGRPRIDIPLLMSYTEFPRPPAPVAPGGPDAQGDPSVGGETDPWLAIIRNALHHKEAHVAKVVRTLYYCAQRYGLKKAGSAIGALDEEGKETHVGAAAMDGTIFVRAAGIVSDALGWVVYGEKEGSWDRTSLGWDEAWENEA
ncbi:hypothetical protein B0H16DRAFT_1506234 [Mycena metata]|uniref:Oxidoreductase AflY n=1 Tax=Mycena metata TaxID=1033252 RepID=A0AAD7K433_9AGAR|nr:hypothetical protein B0H16DRAFT_1506234 [Mycena metata]